MRQILSGMPFNEGKKMKKQIVVMLCSLLLSMPVLSFANEEKEPHPSASAYEHANENAKFKRDDVVFNNKANKAIRAKKLAKKEAAEAKKKVDEVQDKGEGQFKVKF